MNSNYPPNKNPFFPSKYKKLPLTCIKPKGWLRDQLIAQKNGICGCADEFFVKDDYWLGGNNGGNLCEVPGRTHIVMDWFYGFLCTAYLLDDEEMKSRARRYCEYILGTGYRDGSFGPRQYLDSLMPDVDSTATCLEGGRSIAGHVLISYYEVEKDERVIKLLSDYYIEYLGKNARIDAWGYFNNMGRMGFLSNGIWLYNQTGDVRVIEAMKRYALYKTPDNSWIDRMLEGAVPCLHGAGIAGCISLPADYYVFSGDERCKRSVDNGIDYLEREQGQIGGRFTGHEFLAEKNGRDPTNGTETCIAVSYSISMEKLFEVFGDPAYAERAELLMFNALPGACTGDMWSRQYDQQTNQILCTVGKRRFDNDETSNTYGLKPHYPCCTGKIPQAWPKFIEYQWLSTEDGGLIAMSYCPCEVNAVVGDGVKVKLTVDSEYPFREKFTIIVSPDHPAEFPLYLRVPSYVGDFGERMGVQIDGHVTMAEPGTVYKLDRVWHDGDKVEVYIRMDAKFIERSDNSVAVKRGPVYYALRVGEQYKQYHYYYKGSADWEIYPTTPWNIALFASFRTAQSLVEEEHHPISRLPFAHKGEMIYNPEKNAFEPWNEDEPVVLIAKGHIVNNWGLNRIYPQAGAIPEEKEYGQPVEVELIPYGCTNLRIAEFPYIQE